MFNFPTEDIVKAFEAFSEAINQLAADIVDAWEAVTVTVSAVLDDDALWPNRYGMPPKKYGQSLQNTPKSHSSNMTTSRLWQKISLISGEHFSKTA